VPRSLRPGPRAQTAVVGTALAAVLAAATATAALGLPGTSASAPGAPLTRPASAAERVVAPERVVPPQPVPAPVQAAAVPPVVALSGLHDPDVVVRSATTLPPATLEALRTLDGVTGMAVLDAATIDVGGQPAGLVGVDPSQVRAFTPQESAASDELWNAVARGDLAASYSLAQSRALALGAPLSIAGQSGRLGAVAAFGLPNVDLVATREAARARGAVADSVVVLSAPQVRTGVLSKAVAELAGQADVQLLRPADVAPTKVQGKPKSWRELYIDSARYCPGLSWTVLAAIGQVESGHGKNLGPSSAGALGPMQFMPATWASYGLDGDGDGDADIMDPFDAVPSAARYLCRHGATNGEQGLYDAVFAYNHADWYVRKILGLAAQYR
jgi:soluble lytic murein transglycosylase-like protein